MLNNNKKINVGYPLLVGEQAPSVDLRFGPYASVAEAVTRLGASGLDQLVGGVFFGVTQADGTLKVYFFNKDNATATDVTEVGGGSVSAGSIVADMIADGTITDAKLADALRDSIAQAGKADGTSLTKNSATGELSIKNGGVSTSHLADGSVTTPKIADAAVTSAKLASGSVVSDTVADGSITTTKIADASITASKLDSALADSIAQAGKADGTTLSKNASTGELSVKASGVGTTQLADSAVTTAKIADGAITSAKIAAGAITADSLGSGAITSDKLAPNSVTTTAVQNGAITASKLANDAKVGSLVVTEEEDDVKLQIKDAAGTILATDTISTATLDAAGMMSKEDKAKMDSISEGAEANTINTVKLNGTALTPDASKAVNVEAITSVKQNNTAVTPTTGQVNVTDTTYTFSGAASDKITVTPYVNGAAGTPVDVPVTISNNITETTETANQGAIGDLAVYTAAHTLGKRTIATTIAADDTSDAIATAKTVAAHVKSSLGDLAGAMIYKGLVSTANPLPTADYKVGDTYVVNEAGTYAGVACEVGNMLIAKTAYVAATASNADWTACHSTAAVENKDVTLTAGTKSTIATIDGADITVTPPVVDSALNASSLNALQNKVIYEEMEKLKVRYLNICFGDNAETFSYPNISGAIDIIKIGGLNISELKFSHGAIVQQALTLGEQSPVIEIPDGENVIFEIGRATPGTAAISVQYKLK